jgi:hypothetical protein
VDQDIMHQRRAVGPSSRTAPFSHSTALPSFGYRLACLAAMDIFPGRIDRAPASLGLSHHALASFSISDIPK